MKMREIQSLARGLEILDVMVNSGEPQSVTELAKMLSIDKSSVSRLLGTMEKYGYVQQAKDSRAYIVGKRLFGVGWQLVNQYSLRELARPYLDYLVSRTGECSHIGVYSSGQVLVVDDVQSEVSSLRVVGGSGRLLSLHNTALGKSLVAGGDFPLPQSLDRFTSKTITEFSDFKLELRRVFEQGYALDDEENEYGVRCIAAPVFGVAGVVVASIGISGPTLRISYDKILELSKLVCDAAYRLSCELGYEV
jgi:DNA-binding IclR family transcriptional regulator